jgi:Methyltransferase domain
VSTRQAVAQKINGALRPLGVQIVPGYSSDPAIQPWRRAKKTIADARRAGMSVGDYIESVNAEPGATQKTVDTMISFGGLSPDVERICEIGPGSGRYAEKLIEKLRPAHYEVYETADDWLAHLSTLANVEIKPADGHSLTPTASASVDLVHADKVFVYLPFPAVVGYLLEMARVARVGGTIAFDIVTENCLTDDIVSSWSTSGTIFIPMPKAWLVDYLARRSVTLQGSAMIPMVGVQTELLVFRRTG